MNILNVFGIGLDLALLAALVLAVKRRDKLLSKIFLTFLGLSAVYYLTLIFGGEKVRQWVLLSQNGMGGVLGMIVVIVTMIMGLAMTFQWLLEWFAHRAGWDESRKKKHFPLIWLIAILMFFISFLLYSQRIQDQMDKAHENMDSMGSEYSK